MALDLSERLLRDYDVVALILQGGGALGAYQAGVAEGLLQAGIEPTWISGISIGAFNAAIIAGNPPETRMAQLRKFWERIAEPATLPTNAVHPFEMMRDWLARFAAEHHYDRLRSLNHQANASQTLFTGQRGFFAPRPIPAAFQSKGTVEAISFYDTSPLKTTLEEFVDFDRINHGNMRFSVGAVNVATGNFTYFDSAKDTIRAEHVMASGALPPAFPPVEIDSEFYWDGGVVSNTPLEYVLGQEERQDTLVFQVDLWSAKGLMPRDMSEVYVRQKDIQYSSRTRHGTDGPLQLQALRRAVGRLAAKLPEEYLHLPELQALQEMACDKVMNVIQLIYQSRAFESQAKDYEFSPFTMREHWAAGLSDTKETLANPARLDRPHADVGIATHDIKRNHKKKAAA